MQNEKTMLDKKISFVIPCYYSEKSVEGVVNDIFKEFPADRYDIEIVLVNDGSKDNTFGVISSIAKQHDNVIAVNLAKNFGQDGARMAGYSFCSGDYVISLDDDGQNPPSEAHKLIAKLEEGYDAVFGKYQVKKHSRFKNFGSKVNDKMANIMIGKPKDLTLCSYFIMNRFVVNEILKYEGAFPYIWGLVLRCTDNIANEMIRHEAREIGETTYTFAKLLGLWMNGFTSFSVKPLRVSMLLGVFFAFCGFLYLIYIISQQVIFGVPVEGWTSIMTVTLVLSGVQLIMLGMVGEYIGRTFMNANKAPQFVVHDVVQGNKENDED